ncbi:type IV secretion system protein [Kingella oralis]|jgi:hypothetical protein|uniref:type IV secretion system protein n=1 Tax=Kingella oralis TaxID=505 RepID=UPI002D80F5FB|nr:type IV secretion system protein [Kingella oralis]
MVSSVFQDLTDTFVVKFGTELFNNVGTFISNVSPLFASGFCLYIVIIALDAYNRGLDDNIIDLSKRIIGWLIIIAFAFNASQYSSLAQIIYNMPETLSQAFGKSVDLKMFDSAALAMEVIGAQLNLARMALDITDAGNILALWAIIEGWLRFCTNVLLSVVFAYWVIAKIVLALNLMVGPMFIGAMLFPGTRQYGMNWIGQCLNSILTIGLLSVLAGIEIQTFKEHIDNAKMAITQASNMEAIGVALGLIILFTAMTILFVLAAWKVPAMATALTGGASLEGAGAGLPGLAGRQAAGAAKSSMRMAGKCAAGVWRRLRGRGGSIKG